MVQLATTSSNSSTFGDLKQLHNPSVEALNLHENLFHSIHAQLHALGLDLAHHELLRVWMREETLQEVPVQEADR